MNNETITQAADQLTTGTLPKPRKRGIPAWSWVGAACLLTGVAIGTLAMPDPAPVKVYVQGETPAPVTRQVVPEACTLAHAAAEDLVATLASALSESSTIMGAFQTSDYTAVRAASERVEKLTPKVTALRSEFNTQKALCK